MCQFHSLFDSFEIKKIQAGLLLMKKEDVVSNIDVKNGSLALLFVQKQDEDFLVFFFLVYLERLAFVLTSYITYKFNGLY